MIFAFGVQVCIPGKSAGVRRKMHSHGCKVIYWAKVLPEQWELLQIFRTHEIFRKLLKMHFDQTIIHLSKSLNFILIKCLQITSFINILEVPSQNVRLQK